MPLVKQMVTREKNLTCMKLSLVGQALKDLWRREMARAKAGKMRRVPQLCYRHVYRDCWTRLNVKPAKIMQVGVTT